MPAMPRGKRSARVSGRRKARTASVTSTIRSASPINTHPVQGMKSKATRPGGSIASHSRGRHHSSAP